MTQPDQPQPDQPQPDQPRPDPVLVDARGLRCPLPVLRLARAARSLPAGTTLTVLATDPAADPDVRAWARLRGHAVLSVATAPDETQPPPDATIWRLVVRLSE